MGPRPGCVFKAGDSGVGYYADAPSGAPAQTAAPAPAPVAPPSNTPRISAVQQLLDRQQGGGGGGEHRVSRLERVQAEQMARHRLRAAPRSAKDEVTV